MHITMTTLPGLRPALLDRALKKRLTFKMNILKTTLLLCRYGTMSDDYLLIKEELFKAEDKSTQSKTIVWEVQIFVVILLILTIARTHFIFNNFSGEKP